ncbi:HAMP domain-containing histidine kinase [Cerasibacillus terrae]|uniref:histidine kinase n=1 Tax=Cerasibacillus terrae TaxID=2498845 RepID=A0A5C8NKX8_9BACI|nr:HAMP domain-containing sensor histidine kinase [Cerasibacillus terrae]TXL61707.1 HAMP domain-containing histidine kinase [Cerasibacillus terrae]
MKLQDQLNAAFTMLLIIIMTITGFVIYSLIMDLLISNEQRQLEQKGEIIVKVLNEQYQTRDNIEQFNTFLKQQDLQLFLYDRETDTVRYSTMSNEVVEGFLKANDFSNMHSNLMEYRKDKYVQSRILFYPRTTGLELILLTPLHDLKLVQHDFFTRLLLVFLIGAIVAVILSYFLTRKMVTPLTHLKYQLKKIEQRKFDEIEPIEATGEIHEVAKSVYEMANELQRYINSQQTFFQNASHELKTPLMTIQGYAEGIKEGVFDQDETEKGLEVMVMEVKRLKKIINEMTILAKLESEKTVYQETSVDLAKIVEQVIDRMVPLANDKDITLDYSVTPNLVVTADQEKLLRAMLNLTSNGIRHAATVVRIRLFSKNQFIYLTIEDDGRGISKEIIPHIFQRFVKGKHGETGLGLAISRAIIERSDGKIEVGDSDLGGAKFTIVFQQLEKK